MNTPRFVRRTMERLGDMWIIARTFFLRTDTGRWKRNAREIPAWDDRNRLFASLIPPSSSVLDLGAGAQTLRGYLVDCEYQPCDVVEGEGVLFCDYNRDLYPAVTKPYDFVVCSGVLEYIREPRVFLGRVFSLGKQGLLSYAYLRPAETKVKRMKHGWVNHLAQAELEGLFNALNLKWTLLQIWNHQLIYRIGN